MGGIVSNVVTRALTLSDTDSLSILIRGEELSKQQFSPCMQQAQNCPSGHWGTQLRCFRKDTLLLFCNFLLIVFSFGYRVVPI